MTVRSAERPVREEPDAVGDAVLGHAAQKAVVVPDAQLHLHRGNVGDPSRLLDLSDGHVAEANVLDRPVALQRGERAHAGCERRSRVRRVKLIQMDPFDAEGAPAGLARGEEVTRAAVRDPVSLRAGQAAFRGDQDARAIAAPCGDRAGDEPFVVTGLARIPAIGVGGVEQVDAGVKGSVQHLDRARFVPIARRGKAHAAHGNERLWRHGIRDRIRDRIRD